MSLASRQQRLAWIFLAPALLVVLGLGLYPLVQTILASFTDARFGGFREPQFVGLENYRTLAADERFREAIRNTFVFAFFSVSLEFVLGVGIALVVHSRFPGRGMVRAAMLVPWALPTVVSARMWDYMLVDTYGVVNDILVERLGLFTERIAWLAEPGLAMASVIAVDVWKTTPFVALLVLAGLQTIPEELYESADVDGAGPVRRFFSLTLPLLKPIIAVTLIFRTLDALRVFDQIWVMTRGELGTESLATFNYREMIELSKIGYGSAISVAIFAIIGCFVLAYVLLLGRGEEER